MDLSKSMRIEVTTVTTVAGSRPRYLPDGAEWPVTGLVMYAFRDKYGDATGYCVCSGCITDDDKITAYWERIRRGESYLNCDVSLKTIGRGANHDWRCTVDGCHKYGDRL
jgi:hypothetical protein